MAPNIPINTAKRGYFVEREWGKGRIKKMSQLVSNMSIQGRYRTGKTSLLEICREETNWRYIELTK